MLLESESNIVKPSEAKADIEKSASPEKIEEERKHAERNSEETLAHHDGLKSFYSLRSWWAYFIMGCITLLILYDMTLTVLIGAGVLDFSTHSWYLYIHSGANLIEMIGLAFIVVKFLFNNDLLHNKVHKS